MAQLEGHKTGAAILAGEQIPMARIESSNQLPGGVLGIPSGYQAASFDLEPQRIVGGTVKAGDHVTVYATFQDVRVTGGGHVPHGLSGTADDSFSATSLIASDVRVLKVDGAGSGSVGVSTTSSTQSGSGIEITVAVTPTAAEKMVFSQDLGKLYLSLLPPKQDGKKLPPISFWQVLR
jgi:pilus assembly protein CpaB